MCSGIPIKLLNFSDLTKFLVLNFHAKHQIFNGLNTWLLGAVNKFSKNNRSIDITSIVSKSVRGFRFLTKLSGTDGGSLHVSSSPGGRSP